MTSITGAVGVFKRARCATEQVTLDLCAPSFDPGLGLNLARIVNCRCAGGRFTLGVRA